MNRSNGPMYETAADLANQAELLNRVGAKWECQWRSTPKAYAFDAVLTRRGRVAAFAEVKCRNVTSDKYPTYILSAHKWRDLVSFSKATKVPTLLLIGYSDGVVRWLAVDGEVPFKVIVGGRKDRGDEQGVEPMVEIENSEFKRLHC